MSVPGTEQNPLKVAIVGAGPSGFYAAEALLKSGLMVHIDMIERLPAPFGLVRHGVAPDHPKLKEAIAVYDRIARSPGFRFFGNVTVGRDVTVEALGAAYHAVIFASGAETDRRLGVSGEDLPGSYTATEFVGWYNGHPDYRDRTFDLDQEVAIIIGQGNVAADVCRILAKTVDELKHTDIAEHALEALATSRVRDIYVVGRRGPAQAKFTAKELRELGDLDATEVLLDPAELELNPESLAEFEDRKGAASKKNVDILREFAARPREGKARRIHFRFLLSPTAILGQSHVAGVAFERNRLSGPPFEQAARGTGELVELAAGLVFRSIGYKGVAMAGVPFDARQGVFPTRDGRITDEQGTVVPRLYACGWIKRGPTGIIGTNKPCSVATVASVIADGAALDDTARAGAEGLPALMGADGRRVVSYDDWIAIDQAEMSRGAAAGKPREKFTSVEQMLEVVGTARR
ncbi:MAG TPA: FAD-dependent oxidoreductase [Gemmatimonadales bacterium]|nr:FAD-dependent oxidoreductase [Gemmatimonadales bacterium]